MRARQPQVVLRTPWAGSPCCGNGGRTFRAQPGVRACRRCRAPQRSGRTGPDPQRTHQRVHALRARTGWFPRGPMGLAGSGLTRRSQLRTLKWARTRPGPVVLWAARGQRSLSFRRLAGDFCTGREAGTHRIVRAPGSPRGCSRRCRPGRRARQCRLRLLQAPCWLQQCARRGGASAVGSLPRSSAQ